MSNRDVAVQIRTALKRNFPNTKFSVRCDGYDAVIISWTNGASTNDVEALVKPYMAGHFDGMQDMHVYSNPNSDLEQVKYIDCIRTLSANVKAIVESLVPEIGEDVKDDLSQIAYHERRLREKAWSAPHLDGPVI